MRNSAPESKRAYIRPSVPGIKVDAFSEGPEDKGIPENSTLQRRGWADGQENLPPAGAKSLNETELEVVNTFQEALRAREERGKDALDTILKVIDRQEAQCKEPPFDKQIAELRLKANRTRSLHAIDLEQARMDERASFRDLAYFRKVNNLRRTANYPSSHWLAFSILGVAIIAESIGNAVLFARDDPLGWAGGIGQAILLSVANVLLAFCFGYLVLRNINARNPLGKTLAMAGAAVFLGVILLFNLAAGHYRDYRAENARKIEAAQRQEQMALARAAAAAANAAAAAANATAAQKAAGKKAGSKRAAPASPPSPPQQPQPQSAVQAADTLLPSAKAFEKIATQPFDFSYDSIFLVILGLGIAAFAAWEGYVFDDPFPGYGAMDRRHRKSLTQYNSARKKIQLKLTNVLDEDFLRIEREIEDFRRQVNVLKGYHIDFANLRNFIVDHVADYQNRCNQALTIYRTANRSVRTDPAPATFEQLPKLDHGQELPKLGARAAVLQGLEKRVEDLKAASLDARLQLAEKLEDQRNLTEFFDAADRTAEAKRYDYHRLEEEIQQEQEPEPRRSVRAVHSL